MNATRHLRRAVQKDKNMASLYARMPLRPPWRVEVQVLQERKPAMRHTVSGNGSPSMPLAVNGTAVIYSINRLL